MQNSICPGVYPTMITPFTPENRIDFAAVERIVEFYVNAGCQGVLAVCQSSEMFFLSDLEKRELMKAIVRCANGRLQLVASGHTADDEPTQLRQLNDVIECGADAAVLVLNRFAAPDESDGVLKRRMERMINALPGVKLGVYECPYPYKRLFTDELLQWCAETGRIVFIKDTCCRLDMLKSRQRAVENTPLTIYDANTATLLDSMRAGISGYSGIMANFHPDLYVKLFELHAANDPLADKLQSFLSIAAMIESQLYPTNAKAHFRLIGLPMDLLTRSKDSSLWNPTFEAEVNALITLENECRARLG